MGRQIGEFTVFTGIGEFEQYLNRSGFNRNVSYIQNHHTFIPSYCNFKGNNHLALLNAMERSHIRDRGWKQIGQNITTFPDGRVVLCRPIDIIPARIFGANRLAICLEHLGNFDAERDQMTVEHRSAIIGVNALLCRKFKLPVTTDHVVYHHWYDANGNRFSSNIINSGKVWLQKLQKSCPGSGFFSGNKILDAEQYFLPAIQSFSGSNVPAVSSNSPQIATVSAALLNVRTGKSPAFPAVRQLKKDEQVNVFLMLDGWAKIDPVNESWVASRYLIFN